MIIYSNNSIIKYESSQILDLMKQPAPDSANNLYFDYNNFIKAIDIIYSTQELDGNIPIFKSRLDPVSNKIIPDPDSTLRFLVPGESYYIRINSDADLPLRIPNPIGLKEFTDQISINNSNIPTILSCSPKIIVDDNINITNSTAYIINANIIDAISHEKYYYEFTPVFSNWPAILSPRSGEVIIPSQPGPNGKTSGNISALFDYQNSLSNIQSSIPFVIDKNLNNNIYNKNIFSILNLSIWNYNNKIYDKNIDIFCKSCVDNHTCPWTSISVEGTGNTRYINTTIGNLNPNTVYKYTFSGIGSNWPCDISPISGTIRSTNGTTTNIYNIFKFCDNMNICNIPATDNTIPVDPLLTAKLYCNLSLGIQSDNNLCQITSDPKIIECNKCFVGNDFNTKVMFDVPPYEQQNNYEYPELGPGLTASMADLTRPKNEYNLYNYKSPYIICCENPAILKINITDAIPGEKYIYDIYSYPNISVVPNTGILSFGDGSGVISVLAYIEQQKSSSIHITLTHEKSGKQTSDATIIRCPQPW